MRVLIDTNVLISAALNVDGVPYQAYVKAASNFPNVWRHWISFFQSPY